MSFAGEMRDFQRRLHAGSTVRSRRSSRLYTDNSPTGSASRSRRAGPTPTRTVARYPIRLATIRARLSGLAADAEGARRKVCEAKLRGDFGDAPTAQKHLVYLRVQTYNKTVPENAGITNESLKRRQKELLKGDELFGGMKLSKKTRDIGEAGAASTPPTAPSRRLVEYSF